MYGMLHGDSRVRSVMFCEQKWEDTTALACKPVQINSVQFSGVTAAAISAVLTAQE